VDKTHWKAGYYNPRVRNYRWERSATVGEVLCISTKEGNSGTQVYIIGLFQKPKETLEQKFFSVRCWLLEWLGCINDIITTFNKC